MTTDPSTASSSAESRLYGCPNSPPLSSLKINIKTHLSLKALSPSWFLITIHLRFCASGYGIACVPPPLSSFKINIKTHLSLKAFSPSWFLITIHLRFCVGVASRHTPNTGLRHPSFGGKCRKAMLRVVASRVYPLSSFKISIKNKTTTNLTSVLNFLKHLVGLGS